MNTRGKFQFVLITAALAVAMCGAGRVRGADAKELEARLVPSPKSESKNYDGMAADIERVSGLKVKTDPEVSAFFRKFQWESLSLEENAKEISLARFLNLETFEPGLRWEIDADAGTVTLTLAWKRKDERSPEELLKALRKAGEEMIEAPGWESQRFTDEWVAARKPCGELLDALLSKKENYGKGWRTKTMSLHDDSFGNAHWDAEPDMLLVKDFVDADGKQGTLAVVRQNPGLIPGHGDISFYFFTPQGILAHAGLVAAGGDCVVGPASVEKGKSGALSILRVDVRAIGYEETFTEMFEVGADGLRLVKFIRGDGEVLSGKGLKAVPTPSAVEG